MKVPTRVIGRISRRVESGLRIYADSITPAHRKLLRPVVLAILYAGGRPTCPDARSP